MNIAVYIVLFTMLFSIYFAIHALLARSFFGPGIYRSLITFDLTALGLMALVYASLLFRSLTLLEEYVISIGFTISSWFIPSSLGHTNMNVVIVIAGFCCLLGTFLIHILMQTFFMKSFKGSFTITGLVIIFLQSLIAYIITLFSFQYLYTGLLWLSSALPTA